jgi:Holliday junction resolvase
MSFDTFYQLDTLLRKRGPPSFGRICQNLLELCFIENHYTTRGRAVERPDIVAERHDLKYAVECKYQQGSNLMLTQRDLDGVMDLRSSNFIPTIACLLMDINANWIMIKADKLRPGKYNKTSLIIYELKDLSKEINSVFPKIVEDNFELAQNRGSEGIRSKIDKKF